MINWMKINLEFFGEDWLEFLNPFRLLIKDHFRTFQDQLNKVVALES